MTWAYEGSVSAGCVYMVGLQIITLETIFAVLMYLIL